MKGKLLPILGILAVLILSVVTYYSKQTVYNDENTAGNTSSNLMNNGLFCEYEDSIYFSNPADEGRLYVMGSDLSDCKRLSTDTVAHINVAGKYIIYARHNQNQTKDNQNVFSISDTGMYRTDKNGKNVKTLFDRVVNNVNLSGNTVFFQQNNSSGFGVYRIDIDKSNQKEVFKGPVSPLAIKDGVLYYPGIEDNHYIYQTKLSSTESKLLYKGNAALVTVAGNFLYFLDLDNAHALTRIKLDGSNPTILTDKPTSTYNVTPDGKYLYYQVDNGTENGIYRLDLSTKQEQCLKKGDFCNINTTGQFVFFQKFDEDTTYYATHIGQKTAKFKPQT